VLLGGQSFNTSFFALTLTDTCAGGVEGGNKGQANVTETTGLLSAPDVLNVVPLYRPTLKFATKILAIIGLTGESALARGMNELCFIPAASGTIMSMMLNMLLCFFPGVMRYLSDFVRQTLIPYLSGQTNTRLRKILEDKDALAPVQTDHKASVKLPNTGEKGSFISVATGRKKDSSSVGPFDGAGACEVLDLLRSLNVYTSQLPQHGEQISQILQVALLSYVRR